MTDEGPGYHHERLEKHFEEIDREIVKYASIGKVPLLDPGVIERVLHKDNLVRGAQNPRAFDKLRSLRTMHYSVRDKALVALGEQETMAIVKDIVDRLRARAGDKLGGQPAQTAQPPTGLAWAWHRRAPGWLPPMPG